MLINQFGFSRDRCGDSMPADMAFDDLRRGTDLEFGQSIYEPFGIAQVEPLSTGALCVVSDVCGCLGFASLRRTRQTGSCASSNLQSTLPNIVVANYTSLPTEFSSTPGATRCASGPSGSATASNSSVAGRWRRR